MSESFVVSRTAGRPWVLALVLLAVASGFLWMAFESTQQSPRVAGWVFGGAFGLLGLRLLLRSLKKPVRDELVFDSVGVSRVIGGVVWAVRWGDLSGASVIERPQKRDGCQIVLSPAGGRFESPHRSLVRIAGGDFLVAGLGLTPREVARVREVLAQYVDVSAERVVTDPVSGRPGPRDAVPAWMPPPLEPSAAVTIHVNGWDRVMLRWLQLFALMIEIGLGVAIEFGPRNGFRTAFIVVFVAVFAGTAWLQISEQESRSRKSQLTLKLSPAGVRWESYYHRFTVSWPEIAELRTPTRLVEFRPASEDFPLHRPELDRLRQVDGWYRLPRALSPTASKEFDAHIRAVLPGGVRLTVA